MMINQIRHQHCLPTQAKAPVAFRSNEHPPLVERLGIDTFVSASVDQQLKEADQRNQTFLKDLESYGSKIVGTVKAVEAKFQPIKNADAVKASIFKDLSGVFKESYPQDAEILGQKAKELEKK